MRLKAVPTVLISRTGPDQKDTHKTQWFKVIYNSLDINPVDFVTVDPFARNCQLGHPYTNDIDPLTDAQHHLQAWDFLRWFDESSGTKADLVIFDPPFSERMSKDKYEGYGLNLYASDSKRMLECYRIISRIIKPGGMLLKFGYNANENIQNYDIEKIWIVDKGGNRNSTIISLWRNNQNSIYD